MPGRKLFYDTFGDNFESPERSTRLGVRAIAILGGVVGGALKPFLLPVWLVASTVALPIIGAIRWKQGAGDHCRWFRAAAYTAVATAAVITFLAVSSYHQLPLMWTIGTITASVSVSITIHVAYALKNPSSPKLTNS